MGFLPKDLFWKYLCKMYLLVVQYSLDISKLTIIHTDYYKTRAGAHTELWVSFIATEIVFQLLPPLLKNVCYITLRYVSYMYEITFYG